jgi:WD40 repeat protein
MEGSPFTGHTDSVNSVAFSPDGNRIVSGSDDGTIRVWNATTGQMEGSPFTGHTEWSILSHSLQMGTGSSLARMIALFVCGMRPQDKWREAHLLGTHCRILSSHRTIRVWNATTGQILSILSHSLQMGTGSSLARMIALFVCGMRPRDKWREAHLLGTRFGQFCRILSRWEPDRLWLGDRTIRVWNATTGQMEGSPFTGHTDSVNSVAFSPDGNRIVSGSDDRTIRVWNATTGQMEGSPFTGHTDSVNSVAFSPDGNRIVSGSHDRTIRVWNATTGQMEGSPFTGHTDSVNSVAFSPDGHRIVSGSDDGTIRVWNATTGQMEGSPFTGHTRFGQFCRILSRWEPDRLWLG